MKIRVAIPAADPPDNATYEIGPTSSRLSFADQNQCLSRQPPRSACVPKCGRPPEPASVRGHDHYRFRAGAILARAEEPSRASSRPSRAERGRQNTAQPSKSRTRMVEGAVTPLAGRGALVTGAGRGIGRAIAQRLAVLGATVLCVSRTQSELNETIKSASSTAFALPLDISADGAARVAVDAMLAQVPRLDILVHCAGIMPSGSVEEANMIDFDRAFAINVRAPYALTQAALPALKLSQGQVLFVNSNIIRAANIAGRGIYAATQVALKALADCLRDELNPYGVRVLSIMPGATATARREQLHAAAGLTYRPELLLQPEDVAGLACNVLLLPRTAEATDLFVRPMQKLSQ